MIIETALYQDVLEHSSIFRQLPKDKYPNVLRCLNARVVDFPQDASIAALGDFSGCSGILLTGMLEEYLVDENGNQIIINHLRSGDVFGAESVCAGQVASHVYIHTVEKSKILMLPATDGRRWGEGMIIFYMVNINRDGRQTGESSERLFCCRTQRIRRASLSGCIITG